MLGFVQRRFRYQQLRDIRTALLLKGQNRKASLTSTVVRPKDELTMIWG